jgi:hypothetical protein
MFCLKKVLGGHRAKQQHRSRRNKSLSRCYRIRDAFVKHSAARPPKKGHSRPRFAFPELQKRIGNRLLAVFVG